MTTKGRHETIERRIFDMNSSIDHTLPITTKGDAIHSYITCRLSISQKEVPGQRNQSIRIAGLR